MANKKKILIALLLIGTVGYFIYRRKFTKSMQYSSGQRKIIIGKDQKKPFVNKQKQMAEQSLQDLFISNALFFNVDIEKAKAVEDTQFMRDFNIISANIRDEEAMFSELKVCENPLILGDRATEVRLLEDVINYLYGGNGLRENNNYTKKTLNINKVTFKNTSFFNSRTGDICKDAIIKIHNFLIN